MATRELTPLMSKFRNFINRRELVNHLRFEGHKIAKRTGPPPKLPLGASGHIANNYFYTRDGRREANPPFVTYERRMKELTAGADASGETAPSTRTALPKPGFGVPDWQQ